MNELLIHWQWFIATVSLFTAGGYLWLVFGHHRNRPAAMPIKRKERSR